MHTWTVEYIYKKTLKYVVRKAAPLHAEQNKAVQSTTLLFCVRMIANTWFKDGNAALNMAQQSKDVPSTALLYCAKKSSCA